jgi:hypothetical protein
MIRERTGNTGELESLARRAVACKHWRWMPGMRWSTQDDAARLDDYQPEYMGRPSDALPDLTDPATIGCLLALVREAWGLPIWVRTGDYGNEVCWCDGPSSISVVFFDRDADADSEAAALVAVLEAAP